MEQNKNELCTTLYFKLMFHKFYEKLKEKEVHYLKLSYLIYLNGGLLFGFEEI